MVRTCVVRELGGYRDFFNSLGYEDYDLSARIVERYKSIILPEALYKYRQYPGSTSRKDIVYNPFKLHGYLLVQHLIKEREQFGNDSLERNDIPAIINFIVEKNKPYIDDPSLIYRQSMWSHLHKKLYKQAYWYCFKGLKLRPLLWANIKTTMLLVLISLRIIKE